MTNKQVPTCFQAVENLNQYGSLNIGHKINQCVSQKNNIKPVIHQIFGIHQVEVSRRNFFSYGFYKPDFGVLQILTFQKIPLLHFKRNSSNCLVRINGIFCRF